LVVKRLKRYVEWKDGSEAVSDNDLQKGATKTESPSSHIRKGHWHGLWIGKRDGSEERKLKFRWIPLPM